MFLPRMIHLLYFNKQLFLCITETVSSILQAYSVYDEEIGYCQGQSFLAAVLLLHVSITDS